MNLHTVNLYTKRMLEDIILDSEEGHELIDFIITLQEEYTKLKKYCCKRNDCGGRIKENNKPTDAEVLENFEKWLIKTYYLYVPEVSQNSSVRRIYDKLQEFKEVKK